VSGNVIKFVNSHLIYSGVGTVGPNIFFGQYNLILRSCFRTYDPPDYRTEGMQDLISDSEDEVAPAVPEVEPEPQQPQVAVAAGCDTIRHGEYTVVLGGSQRGKDILVDANNFTYNVQKKRDNSIWWQCTHRPKNDKCHAIVTQLPIAPNEYRFEAAGRHQCPINKHRSVANMVIMKRAKSKAIKNIGVSARKLLAETEEEFKDTLGILRMNQSDAVNAVNKHRQSVRPKEPTNADFQYDENFCPDFKIAKVTSGPQDAPHVAYIFATPGQLARLSSVRTWYVDATFKVVGKPFYQLWTFIGHIRRPGPRRRRDEKVAVNLVYAVMSKKTTGLYCEVIKAILRALREKGFQIKVDRVMLDFEMAEWNAFRNAFEEMDVPVPKLSGCVFHWAQSVMRKIQAEGLRRCYEERTDQGRFLRRLIALPLVPPDAVFDMVLWFNMHAPSTAHKKVTQYILDTYAHPDKALFKPESWSGYRRLHRTNNACENNHHSLNSDTTKNLGFYRLVMFLYQRSRRMSTLATHVEDGDLTQNIRRKTYERDAKLNAAWDLHYREELTDFELLEKVNFAYRPK